MTAIEHAVSLFLDDCNCAQAILGAYGGDIGIAPEMACRIASPFGGGMQTADTCGAVSGALMVLGLRHGPSRCDDKDANDAACDRAAEFQKRFRARHGTSVCRDLLGCDISTEEGLREAKERELFKRVCPDFVRDAAEVLEELR